LDVAVLGSLVSPAKQDHDGVPISTEIHAVARAEVDPQLVHALPHGSGVAEVAQSDPGDALADAASGCFIAKSSEPVREQLPAESA
jgi:hypothetical protein